MLDNLLQNPIIQGLLTGAIWEWGRVAKESVENFALQAYINRQLKALAEEDSSLDAELLKTIEVDSKSLSKKLARIAQETPQNIRDIKNKDELQKALQQHLKELKITGSFKEIEESEIEIKAYEKIENSFKKIKDSTIRLG